MTYSFTVPDDAFPYLVKQRGNIKSLKDDRTAWQAAYDATLRDIHGSLTPWLPSNVRSLMDVGSGLGGMDVLLSQTYRETLGFITLVDGIDDPPVKTPAGTFSNQEVSKRYLRANGVEQSLIYISPKEASGDAFAASHLCPVHDLIVSFGSWCFHLPPRMYLEFVKMTCHADTVLILDVRTDPSLSSWVTDLDRALTRVGVAFEEDKYQRVVYRP